MSSNVPSALRLKALEKIPLTARRIALAAAEGSMGDLDIILKRCEQSEDPKVAQDYLPVVYALLDPKYIPTPEMFEASRFGVECTAYIAEQAIAILWWASYLPEAVHRTIWPRVWAWIQFFEVYSTLKDTKYFGQTCGRMLQSVRYMCAFPRLAVEVLETPDVARFLGKLWAALVHLPQTPSQNAAISAVYDFLVHGEMDALNDEIAREVAEGIQSFDWKVNRNAYINQRLVALAESQEYSDAVRFHGLLLICYALRDHQLYDSDFISALAKTLLILSTREFDPEIPAAMVVELILTILETAFKLPETLSELLPAAMRAGLVSALIGLARHPRMDDAKDALEPFISKVACKGMMLYPVVEAAAKCRVPLPSAGGKYWDEDLGRACDELIQVVQDRTRLLAYYKSEAYQTKRMCSNPLCPKVVPETRLRRCSGCLSAFFCTRDCARAAREIEHRHTCPLFRELDLVQQSRVSKRFEHFLRVILLRDYRARKLEIFLMMLASLCHPQTARSHGPPIIEFDYRSGPVSALHLTHTTPRKLDGSQSLFTRWTPTVTGRSAKYVLSLHHVVLPVCGGSVLRFDYVLCSPRAEELFGALRKIAKRARVPRDLNLDAEVVKLSETQWDEVYR
ncbi:MYND-type domain-containing protein [Mycena chlorophos]|uniref:MYND-type domain-containing protein n=1 Tax=Mycena chlorophos TaxID=658473 RepID=A0A8H6TQF3_MYCCL|nr:MYND-type domain-containing protein [Mycena chlorophos]